MTSSSSTTTETAPARAQNSTSGATCHFDLNPRSYLLQHTKRRQESKFVKILQVSASPWLCTFLQTLQGFYQYLGRVLPNDWPFSVKSTRLPLGHDALGQLPMGGSILATLVECLLQKRWALQHCFLVVWLVWCVFAMFHHMFVESEMNCEHLLTSCRGLLSDPLGPLICCIYGHVSSNQKRHRFSPGALLLCIIVLQYSALPKIFAVSKWQNPSQLALMQRRGI